MYDMVKSSHLLAYQRAIEGISSMIKGYQKNQRFNERKLDQYDYLFIQNRSSHLFVLGRIEF